MKFYHCCLSEKMLLATTWKNALLVSPVKNPSDANVYCNNFAPDTFFQLHPPRAAIICA